MYSMVVAATARPLPFEDPLSTPLVEGSGHTTSASYRRSSRVTRWTGEGQLTHASIVSFTIIIGKRERANLVVQTARFFYIFIYDRVRRVSAHARLRYALLFIRNHFHFFHMCYLRMHQESALLHAAMMAHADTVIVCSLPLTKNAMHSPTSYFTSHWCAYRRQVSLRHSAA